MGGAFAATANAQTATCQNAQFSPALVEQFPNIRDACLDIVTENGEQRALFKADVTRVYPRSNALKVRFKTPDGRHTPARYIELPEDFRVQLDGRGHRIRDLQVGQELTAHVKVSEPAIALASVSEVRFVVIQRDAPAEVEQERTAALMPGTASPLPLLLLLSGVFGVGAGALCLLRRRV